MAFAAEMVVANTGMGVGMAQDPADPLRRQFDAVLRDNHSVRKAQPIARGRLVALSRAPTATLDRLLWFMRHRKVHTKDGWTHWMTKPENEKAALLNAEPAGLCVILAGLVPPSPFGGHAPSWPKTPYDIAERVFTLASPLAIDITGVGLAPDFESLSRGGVQRIGDWLAGAISAVCREVVPRCDPNWVRADFVPSTVLVLCNRNATAMRFLWPFMCVHRRCPARFLGAALDALRAELPKLGQEAATATVRFMPAETGVALPVYGSSGTEDTHTQLLLGAWRDGNLGVGTVAACAVLDGLAVDVGHLGGHVIRQDDPRSLETALPVLCSPNPNGRTVVRLRDEDAETVLGFAPLAPLAGGDMPDLQVGCTDGVANEYDTPDEQVRRAVGVLRAVHVILRLISPQIAEDTAKVFDVGNSIACAVSRSHEGFLVWRDWVRRCCPHSALTDETLQGRWASFTMSNSRGLNDLVFLLRQDSGERYMLYHMLRVADCRNEPTGEPGRAMGLRRQFGTCEISDVSLWVQEAVRDVVACTSTGTARDGPEWWVFSKSQHRWKPDRSGGTVRRMAKLCLDGYVRHARNNPGILGGADGPGAGAGAGAGAGPGGRGRPPPQPLEVLLAILNSPRDLDVVVRTMATEMERPGFLLDLDQNDHLLPFRNGVLDMQKKRIRPGCPGDMLSKGPSYAWKDRGANDVDLRETEYKILTMFPDRNLCQFFLQVGASMLVKGNRHKHMYCGTGNTGGGKSLVNSLNQMAFGDAACVIPVSFLCTEDTDPGKAMDPIARSHGCSYASASESDRTKQKLMGGKIKRIVTPRDGFPVRMLYGATFTMIIKWVLFLWCNGAPAISNIEDAIMLRVIFLTYEAMFAAEDCVPINSSEQIAKARFRMQTEFLPGELETAAQCLMNIYFATFNRYDMDSPTFSLKIPKRVSYCSEGYFRRATMLRRWVKAFVRPTTWTGAIISPASDEALRVLGRLADELHAVWVQWKARVSAGDGNARTVVGSVEWARAACDGLRALMPTKGTWPPNEAPLVTTRQILTAFNGFIAGLGGSGATQTPDADGEGAGSSVARSRRATEVDNLDPMTFRRIVNEELRRDEISESVYLGYAIINSDPAIRAMGNLPSVQKVAQAAANCAINRMQTRGWYPPHPANLPVEEITNAQIRFSMLEMGGGSMGQTRAVPVPKPAPSVPAITAGDAAVVEPEPARFYVPPGDAEFETEISACLRRSGVTHPEKLRELIYCPVDFAKQLAVDVNDDVSRGASYVNPALKSTSSEKAIARSWREKIDNASTAATVLTSLDLGSDAMNIDAKKEGRMSHFDFGFSHAGEYQALMQCEGGSGVARRTGARCGPRAVRFSLAPHPTAVMPSVTRASLRELPTEMLSFYEAEERRENLAALADDSDMTCLLVAAGIEREDAKKAAADMVMFDRKRPRSPEEAQATCQAKCQRVDDTDVAGLRVEREDAAPSDDIGIRLTPKSLRVAAPSAFVPVTPAHPPASRPATPPAFPAVPDMFDGINFRPMTMTPKVKNEEDEEGVPAEWSDGEETVAAGAATFSALGSQTQDASTPHDYAADDDMDALFGFEGFADDD